MRPHFVIFFQDEAVSEIVLIVSKDDGNLTKVVNLSKQALDMKQNHSAIHLTTSAWETILCAHSIFLCFKKFYLTALCVKLYFRKKIRCML